MAKDFQTTTDKNINRTDHVWFRSGGVWKCCLCGALTASPPRKRNKDDPDDAWLPERGWERLSEEERDLVPGGDRAEKIRNR